MFIITNQITKTELLKEMSNSLANSETSLHLEVESLPNFLNTGVAFTIFNYQISNFPKPVFWLSYDNSIVQFLHNCRAKFPPNFLEAQQPLLTAANSEFFSQYLDLDSLSLELEHALEEQKVEKLDTEEKLNLQHKNYKLVENFDELSNQTTTKISDFNSKKNNNSINFNNSSSSKSFKPNFSDYSKSSNINLENDFNQEFEKLARKNIQQNPQNKNSQNHNFQNQNLNNSKTQNFGRKKIDFNFPISEQLKNISEFESLSAKNLFRNNHYNQSSLIGTESEKLKTQPKKIKFDWNLKGFFTKKSKLDKIKNNFNEQNINQNEFQWQQNQPNYKPNNQTTDKNYQQNSLKNDLKNNVFSFKQSQIDQTNNLRPNQQINSTNKISYFDQSFGTNNLGIKSNETVKTKKQRQQIFFEQNLKLKREKMKSKINFQQDIFNFNPKNQLGNLWSKILTKKNTLIAAITSFSFAVIIFFFFLSFFPTQAYTLQISPISGKNKTEFELNLQQFENQSLTISTTEKVPTTGKQKTDLPKSIGKFQLINRGTSPVYITNGGFLTFIENKRYLHKFNPKLPATIIIPAFNENSKMEIELEAENKGDNYNLATNISLNITNLKGEGVCDNCFAKSMEEIKNSRINTQNIVSEDDKNKLLEITENSINKKISTEIEKISQNNSNILIDKNWYKIIDKNPQLNSEVGKPTNELISTNSFNITFWTLKKDQIIKLIKEKDDKIFIVNNLRLENSSGSVEQKSFKITVNYNYLQYENLSRDEIIQELSQKPVQEVQKQLQTKYLGLKNIQKEEKGIRIPGINPRINLNIIKNNSQNSLQTESKNSE